MNHKRKLQVAKNQRPPKKLKLDKTQNTKGKEKEVYGLACPNRDVTHAIGEKFTKLVNQDCISIWLTQKKLKLEEEKRERDRFYWDDDNFYERIAYFKYAISIEEQNLKDLKSGTKAYIWYAIKIGEYEEIIYKLWLLARILQKHDKQPTHNTRHKQQRVNDKNIINELEFYKK